MPSLTQLEYITAVDSLRHFGRAADRCHVTQPTLSTQIQKVEAEIGYPIFDRLKKPVVPTSRGRRFIAQAQVLLNEHRKLIALSRREGATLSGELRLGVIPTVAPYLIPRFLESFGTALPDVALTIDEVQTDSILDRLRDNQLDAGIMATPLGITGLSEHPLFYEPFSLYVGRGEDLNKRRRIREDDLDPRRMWLLGDGHCLRNQVVRFCASKHTGGVFANVRFEGGTLETLRHLVRQSRGYTLVPELFVETLTAAERRDYVRDFENPRPSREVSLVYRRDQWKGDLLTALAQLITATIPEPLRTRDPRRHDVLKVR